MALSRFVHADIGRFKPAPRAPASPPALPSIGSLSVYGMAPSLDSLRSSLGSVDASARELLLGALSLAQVSETAIDDRALMRNGQLVFRLEERALRASFRAPYKMLFTKPKSSILRVQKVPCSPSFSPSAPTDEKNRRTQHTPRVSLCKLDSTTCEGMFDMQADRVLARDDSDSMTSLVFDTDNGRVRLVFHFHPPLARTLDFQPPNMIALAPTGVALWDRRHAVTVARVSVNECALCHEPVALQRGLLAGHCCRSCLSWTEPVCRFQFYCSQECKSRHLPVHRDFCVSKKRRVEK